MSSEHLPVLVREVNEILVLNMDGFYIDATVGLGGHTGQILKLLGSNGKVLGIDRDDEALKRTGEKLMDSRLILKKGNFSDIGALLHSQGVDEVDGILFDLGVSMMQLRDLERGFSFNSDERLDMRMDRSLDFSAWDVVNGYPVKELIRILKEYGEEYNAPRIVRAISSFRQRKSIDTCSELAGIISGAVGRRGRINPATKTFQALRIEVNKEIEELKKGLDASLKILKKGGRFCVISYHSIEDRVVKNFIRDNARQGTLKQLMKKPMTPGTEELRVNPSSRSAKMRGAERL
ncbi:MAG: 16S rRNA (cytosine(1402)-N(4))-methyltransferase [Nitrospirae bacterium GWC2_42_7]|nr:MAG: 16S rRNA (cytosine(1402)-N(4))-methyltransferase [Nitrospirae bacterium GWC2_42_7]